MLRLLAKDKDVDNTSEPHGNTLGGKLEMKRE